MKIFISWSGDTSRELAQALKNWLPKVLQAVTPYFTPDDIDKGIKWQDDILNSLNDSSIGIICLTNENLEKPWILFEAGALSNRLENAKVCPILFNVKKANVKGPLAIFQLTEFLKEDFKKLIKSINSQLENPVTENVIDETFEVFFPKLEKEVIQIIHKNKNQKTKKIERSDRELLEEILELTRQRNQQADTAQNDFIKLLNSVKHLGNDFDRKVMEQIISAIDNMSNNEIVPHYTHSNMDVQKKSIQR